VVFVDSSVWIDFLKGKITPEVLKLREYIRVRFDVIVGDLVLAEVLQGTRTDKGFEQCLWQMSGFQQISISTTEVAIQAAQNYRILRTKGITIRKTIDTLIATRCIIDNIPLLYSDRDFDPFVEHLGLIPAVRA
jgi:predicted nucleic acid-binding protein